MSRVSDLTNSLLYPDNESGKPLILILSGQTRMLTESLLFEEVVFGDKEEAMYCLLAFDFHVLANVVGTELKTER